MNFRNALSELCSGQNDIGAIARRNQLDAEQILALKAVSRKVADDSGLGMASPFIASMMA
jgi:hypothetical protein